MRGVRSAQAEEFTRRRMVLPDGAFEITGPLARPKILGANLSDEREFEPVYIAPHFYWGASDDVTLGITHETGLCLSGEDDGCAENPYNDVGFAALANLIDGDAVELDLHFGVPVRSFEPFFRVGVKTGVLGRIRLGMLAFVFDPYVYVGLSNRDRDNRERLVLPLWLYFQVAPNVAPFVGVAAEGPLDDFWDHNVGPVEGGIVFEVADPVDLGAVLRFHDLVGEHPDADFRELGMLARFRFD